MTCVLRAGRRAGPSQATAWPPAPFASAQTSAVLETRAPGMETPFTVKQLCNVSRDYDSAEAYHLAYFTRINPLAYALADLST